MVSPVQGQKLSSKNLAPVQKPVIQSPQKKSKRATSLASNQIQKAKKVVNLDKALDSQFDGAGVPENEDVPNQYQRDMDIVFKELNLRKTQIIQSKNSHDRDMKVLKQYMVEKIDSIYAKSKSDLSTAVQLVYETFDTRIKLIEELEKKVMTE